MATEAERRSKPWVGAIKCIVVLGVVYGVLGALAYGVLHMKHVSPLPSDASSLRFSEGRALSHVWHLAHTIGIRQEGSPGLHEAAEYIKEQVGEFGRRASSNITVEVDDSSVSGSFNMIFLRHSISLAYRKHRNILVRIASAHAKDDDPTVLINGHFDSPLGSPGAGDCGSCIASMLEVARLIIDSGWVPPHPIIFLFNGAEELFLLASHGFMRTHKWRDTIGAFINVEAAGTGGIDLVCQSGPGSWPSWVYAKSAIYPMAHSAAQDIFPLIPGDTDYRIFAEDYGDIPGLDIIFLIGGYFYHTSYDKPENILPGSMQARGENLFSVLKALSSSSQLQNAKQRADHNFTANRTVGDRPIFFDYLSWFMVYYSKKTAQVLHVLPAMVVLVALFSISSKFSILSLLTSLLYIIKGMTLHAGGLVLAVIIPAVLAFVRLLVSNSAMIWYANPWLALLMFVPSSLVGLLLPRFIWGDSLANNMSAITKTSKEEALDWMSHWGSVAFYSSLTLVYLYFGLGGGFLTFWWAAFLIVAWPFFFPFCSNIWSAFY
uniref:Peptidase M28 domain-containing protein n=1 Tax=Araucaria cunninghamii TaxID=56994 RepID=A0A0D6QZ11_ARACU